MPKYRKKPVVIEAIVFNDDPSTLIKIGDFIDNKTGWINVSYADRENPKLSIETLEGTMQASIGDYIIKGINGEFYPCKPDIFAKTYDEVKPVDTQGGDAYREIMYNGWAAKQELKGDDQ